MTVDWAVVATIAAPIIALFLGVLIDRYIGKRPRVIAHFGHVAEFVIKGTPDTNIFTHSLVISNVGRETAKNVRLGHHDMPKDYRISPAVAHTVVDVQGTGSEILFPRLLPKEQVTISYLYFVPVTADKIHSYLKSDSGFAQIVPVILQRLWPKWVGNTVLLFALIGVVSLIYVAYAILN